MVRLMVLGACKQKMGELLLLVVLLEVLPLLLLLPLLPRPTLVLLMGGRKGGGLVR